MPPTKSRFSKRFATLLAICLPAIAVVGTFAAWIALNSLPSEGQPAHGLFIGGQIPPSDQPLHQWLEHRNRATASEPVVLLDGFHPYQRSFGELGISIDIEYTVEAALAIGREASLLERARMLYHARQGFFDIPLRYTVDTQQANAELHNIAALVRKEPVDAYVNLTAHLRVEDIPGTELAVEATLASITQRVIEGERVIRIHTNSIPADVTIDDITRVDVTKLVSSSETTFSTWGDGRSRSRNIRLAAAAIDGTVLMPGQLFSFNTTVGKRTTANGYVLAPVINGDELEPGVGGGICQVASTLHASVLHAAMLVTERTAHSRPSSYTRLGLDATVSYPSKDLKFVNTLPYPVILHLHFPDKGRLRAEILGGNPVATVSYRYAVLKTKSFVRRIITDASLSSKTSKRKQKGILGYSVVSTVLLDYGDKTDSRTYSSEYRPTPEIFLVAPDYSLAELPDLPSGASGVEALNGMSQ